MPWLIPGLKETENINLDPATFRPEMLPKRSIRTGRDQTLVAIPTMPGRVRSRKDGYVELILETYYDKETKQSRNKKVIIGRDDSAFLPGMMTPNDNYYDYFNGQGRLFNDPMKQPLPQQTEAADKEPNQTEQKTEATQHTEATDKQSKPTEQQTKTTRQPKSPQQPKASTQLNQLKPEGKPTDNTKELELLKKKQELTEREIELNQRERELDAREKRLEEKEEDLYFQAEETDKDHIKILSYILDSYKDTIEHQARKKPDAPMSPKQIQTINEILSELKDFFTGCETDNLLHLAEEPDPATGASGTTNGEMALLISAYQFTINAFQYDELRNK